MSSPVHKWLVRPLARFGRLLWMSTANLWPAGLSSPQHQSTPPRKPVRLEGLMALETRSTPDDLMSILTSGVALGGLPLISGQFVTPIAALFKGWGDHALQPLPSPVANTHVTTTNPPDIQGFGRFVGLDMTSQPRPDRDAASQPQMAEPAPPAKSASVGDDWLAAVGSFLDSGDAKPGARTSAPDSVAPPSGGGGGGGSAGDSVSLPAQTSSFPASTMGVGPSALPTQWGADASHIPTGTTAPTTTAATTGVTQEAVAGGNQEQAQPPSQVVQASLTQAFGRSQLAFEANVGQADPQAIFLSHGPGFALWLTKDQMVFGVARTSQDGGQFGGSDVFGATMVGASPDAEIVALDELQSRSNYFIGDDPSLYHTDVAQFGRVEYRNVYAGVDFAAHSRTVADRTFEYDYIVHPGADASVIDLRWNGLTGIRVDDQGRLVLSTGGGDVIQEAPILYQMGADGQKQTVAGGYVLRGDNEIGFQVTGDYDRTKDLVIDPSLSFSSYLGGSLDDSASGIAVDAVGNAYISGSTFSSNFPTTYGYQSALGGGGNQDAFVTKFNAAGNQVVYSTYLGGSGVDLSSALALDAAGSAYVTGTTSSTDLPTTDCAYDRTYPGQISSFITKFNATGDLLAYSTYTGASYQTVKSIAVDPNGQAYVTGTISVLSPGMVTPGGFQSASGGKDDAFLIKFNASGSTLVYASYLGGSEPDAATGITVDAAGEAFVTGNTISTNFPTTAGAYQTAGNGITVSKPDAFVVKVSADGSQKLYSTYLGGTDYDAGNAIAIDPSGQAFVAGSTLSTDFPTTAGVAQTGSGGAMDAFLTKLNAAGSALLISTYLGGSGTDNGFGVAVDLQGRPTVVGSTSSTNFPTAGAVQGTNGGGPTDAFVTRLTAAGTLSYSTYLGGSGTDGSAPVALDPVGSPGTELEFAL